MNLRSDQPNQAIPSSRPKRQALFNPAATLPSDQPSISAGNKKNWGGTLKSVTENLQQIEDPFHNKWVTTLSVFEWQQHRTIWSKNWRACELPWRISNPFQNLEVSTFVASLNLSEKNSILHFGNIHKTLINNSPTYLLNKVKLPSKAVLKITSNNLSRHLVPIKKPSRVQDRRRQLWRVSSLLRIFVHSDNLRELMRGDEISNMDQESKD